MSKAETENECRCGAGGQNKPGGVFCGMTLREARPEPARFGGGRRQARRLALKRRSRQRALRQEQSSPGESIVVNLHGRN